MSSHETLFRLAWDLLEGTVESSEGDFDMRTASWSRQRPKYKKRPRNTETRREKRRDKKRYKLRKSKLKRYRRQNKRKLKEYQKHYKNKPNLHKVKGRV